MTLHHLSPQTAAVLAFLITVALAVAAALVGAMPEWVAQSADSLPLLPAQWDTLLPLEASASH
ncbi:MAG: hypothetical protein O9331_09665 [Acidovorax sp.]|jgi:hypothetical protein|uniref:hypothetical protein n=1 Tax=Acidovorax sp. 106 TaxID=2135637 RepID=UPI000EACFCDD|nr:hypothetical protein [Acidovorax sp. 106]MCZ8093742.1 hypothetical protein [Acidovorax sp.]RLJ36528.1 hypothetical protein C8C98_0205 [Acidovorax sp. 106]